MFNRKSRKNEDGKITVHGMLEHGDFVSRHSYSPGQQDEIRLMLRESARAAARELKPELAHKYDVIEERQEQCHPASTGNGAARTNAK